MKYFNYDIFRKNEKGKYEKVNENKRHSHITRYAKLQRKKSRRRKNKNSKTL